MQSSPIDRTVFLIDGFNLYHSIKQAEKDIRRTGATPPSMRWIDIQQLCLSYMHLLGRNARLLDVYYFSALATHLESFKPDVVKRHQTLIDALSSTGVIVELGRFKEKRIKCSLCNQEFIRHEEKETDVAISLKILELFSLNSCDTVIFVTGDTDLAPAARSAQRLFPQKRVLFAFPYGRKNKELLKIAPGSFNLSKEQYAKYQFSSPLVLEDGRILNKPEKW